MGPKKSFRLAAARPGPSSMLRHRTYLLIRRGPVSIVPRYLCPRAEVMAFTVSCGYGPNLSAHTDTPVHLFLSLFFLSLRDRGRDNICRGRTIARTRAICPGNVPHGMPSVCLAFVSASFRFLRQHGGLSVIYPCSPNTRYF